MTATTVGSLCFARRRSACSAQDFTVAGFRLSRPRIAASLAASLKAASPGAGVWGSEGAEEEASEEAVTSTTFFFFVWVFVLLFVALGWLWDGTGAALPPLC